MSLLLFRFQLGHVGRNLGASSTRRGAQVHFRRAMGTVDMHVVPPAPSTPQAMASSSQGADARSKTVGLVGRLSQWERTWIMVPMQRLRFLDVPSQALAVFGMVEFLVVVFATLYWCLDQHKNVCGIWLVPLNEILNGCIKWLTRRGRPGWADERVELREWSDEFSFPSSHTQITAALALWFVLSSAHAEAVTVTPSGGAALITVLVGASRVQLGGQIRVIGFDPQCDNPTHLTSLQHPPRGTRTVWLPK